MSNDIKNCGMYSGAIGQASNNLRTSLWCTRTTREAVSKRDWLINQLCMTGRPVMHKTTRLGTGGSLRTSPPSFFLITSNVATRISALQTRQFQYFCAVPPPGHRSCTIPTAITAPLLSEEVQIDTVRLEVERLPGAICRLVWTGVREWRARNRGHSRGC